MQSFFFFYPFSLWFCLVEELKPSEGMQMNGEGAADLRALGSNWVKEGLRATR